MNSKYKKANRCVEKEIMHNQFSDSEKNETIVGVWSSENLECLKPLIGNIEKEWSHSIVPSSKMGFFGQERGPIK